MTEREPSNVPGVSSISREDLNSSSIGREKLEATSAALRSTSDGGNQSESTRPPASLHGIVLLLVFLAAFLAFLVQPLAARFLLPRFGGGSSVWTICLVFFQVTLTIGYAYAHLVARTVPIKRQPVVHASLLVVSALTIPILSGNIEPNYEEDPAYQLLFVLLRQVGLPFLLLSGTSPLVQSWYARVKGGAAYRLYGISNLGSLLGLLAYPFALEPLLGLTDQSWLWSGLYAVLILVGLACWRVFSGLDLIKFEAESKTDETTLETSNFARLMWFAIPAVASMLLLATSSRITQNIAPVPLLWVLPIGLYLLAFALAFSGRALVGRLVWVGVAAVSLTGTVLLMQLEQTGGSSAFLESLVFDLAPAIVVRLAIYMATVFFVCRVLFAELFLWRPPTDRLTGYYLAISTGGALGGGFVGLVAPHVFSGYWELPISYGGSALLVALCLLANSKPTSFRRKAWTVGSWITALVVLEFSLLEYEVTEMKGALLTRRGFYGVLSIHEQGIGDDRYHKFKLYHGNICHGIQFVEAEKRSEPTTYYTRTSGAGLTLAHRPDNDDFGFRVGMIGLGTGTLAAYGQPGDLFRFYEIDPIVVELANQNFNYLADSEAEIELALGDARVSLQNELAKDGSQRFDVLLIDAFSGDAIPVHLLTREAFELYWNHLEPDGALVIHTSNRYVELAPVAHALAHELGLKSVAVEFEDDDESKTAGPADYSSDWVVISRNEALFEQLSEYSHDAPQQDLDDSLALWTDDHSHLLHAMELWD